MNFIKRLTWPIIIVLAVFVGFHWQTVLPTMHTGLANFQQRIALLIAAPNTENETSSSTHRQSKQTNHAVNRTSSSRPAPTRTANSYKTVANPTPTEPIVQGVHLSDTYYYHFAPKLPAAAKVVFKDAVATYNRTGIVHLVAGQGGSRDNQITFALYHKAMPTGQRQIELGEGGPKIYQWTSLAGTTSDNHGRASLNGDYSHAFTDTVAIHELGHALGLDHSNQRNSVMYPMSQGSTQLTDADIAGLVNIYQKSK